MNYVPKEWFPYYLDLVRNGDRELLFTSTSGLTFLDSIDEKKQPTAMHLINGALSKL